MPNKVLIGVTLASVSTLIFICASTSQVAVTMDKDTSEVWLTVKPRIGRKSYFKLNNLVGTRVRIVESQDLHGM